MADQLHFMYFDSPIGRLRLISDGKSLLRVEFEDQHGDDGIEQPDPLLKQAIAELREYFSGSRRQFTVALNAPGTAFQRQVWGALREIPYGELRSYRDIAEQLGNGRAVRAVGAANGRNPLPIIVPCHRVIGSNGRLTGFAGGLTTKARLLALEGVSVDC